jgi:hypothetical protein
MRLMRPLHTAAPKHGADLPRSNRQSVGDRVGSVLGGAGSMPRMPAANCKESFQAAARAANVTGMLCSTACPAAIHASMPPRSGLTRR